MGKRKRDAVSEEAQQDAAKSQEIQRRAVRKKLSLGSKALTRALKKSKRHEIQRLAKRTTRAKSAGDSEQRTRLQREVEALKVRRGSPNVDRYRPNHTFHVEPGSHGRSRRSAAESGPQMQGARRGSSIAGSCCSHCRRCK